MIRTLLLSIALIGPAHFATAAAPSWNEHPEWSTEFSDRAVSGAALIYDEQANRYDVFDRKRAEKAFSPASTFKLLNALIGLETGAVTDEHEVFKWDGKKRQFDTWNRDHDLASGMKYSVVWMYQEMARRIGQQRMQAWVDKVGYGNRDIGGGIDQFWLDGKLRITAVQQIAFLRRLAAGSLPFSQRSQQIVQRISIVDTSGASVTHAKTGWHSVAGEPDYGWYVGWVERDGRRWFFAINMDMPHGIDDAPKRGEIARALLRKVDALAPAG